MIDLHSHTNQSDGSATPEELIRDASALGLEALGITDHDTLSGYDLARPYADAAGLELICGIELSTRIQPEVKTNGKRRSSIHLLGYFPETAPSASFRDWLTEQQNARRRRNEALIAKLNSLGVEITLEEVQELGRNLTGRPHFAQVLLKKGYVKNLQEAFDVYLADHAKAAVEREEPSLVEGIHHIREAGGLPVLAHPLRLEEAADEGQFRTLVRSLVEEGLQGLEVYYSEHTPAMTAMFHGMAQEFSLLATGGSDYHGTNKPHIALGTGKGQNLNVPYAVLASMKERARQA